MIVKAGGGLRFSFGVRAWTEMEIWCVKGMHRLKLVSCEIIQGLKGFKCSTHCPPRHLFSSSHSFKKEADLRLHCRTITPWSFLP